MKIGCANWSLHRSFESGAITLENFPEVCKSLGIEGLEINVGGLLSTEKKTLMNFKEKVHSLELEIFSICPFNDFIKMDKVERLRQVEHVNEWIKVANVLEAYFVRVYGGAINPAVNKYYSYKLIKNSLKECLKVAEDEGVVLALENNKFTAGSDIVIKLLKDINSENLKSCLDVGNLPEFPNCYEAIEDLAKYAAYIHAKTWEFDEEGNETRLDYFKIAKIMKKRRFSGYWSAEYEGKGIFSMVRYWPLPMSNKDEVEGLKKTIDLLKLISTC